MVLLALHQSCCISQAVALLVDCHIPQQLPISDRGSVGNLMPGEGCEGNGVGGIGGCAQSPFILQMLAGIGWLEASEIEGDLAGGTPESWHSNPTGTINAKLS